MVDLFFLSKRRRYSVERLQRLHQSLLSLILIDTTTTTVPAQVATTTTTADADAAVKQQHHENNGHVAAATVSRDHHDHHHGRDLQTAAFMILAATRSSLAEHNNKQGGGTGTGGGGGHGRFFGVSMVRDDASVAAFTQAQSMEQTVVQTIQEMGLVLVHASSSSSSSSSYCQKSGNSINKNNNKSNNAASSSSCTVLRSDEVFEYFCQEAILALLVQIVQEKPGMDRSSSSAGSSISKSSSNSAAFHGVVWSPRVKAQVLSTVSMLISAIRNNDTNNHSIANNNNNDNSSSCYLSALYYILSQNSVNQLVSCILPLHQWTDPALEIMLPAYVDLLKTLVLQLSASPDLLFPFFIIVQNNIGNKNNNINNKDTTGNKDDDDDDDDDYKDSSSAIVYSFPLFSATLETGTSTYATQYDSYVHAECLNLTVDLLQIPHLSLQEFVVRHARHEQGQLARYLCSWLWQRTTRMVQLTTGPIVDAIRSNALTTQLTGLDDQMQVWNDVFGCCISTMRGGSLHVRLCENFLQSVARHLLCDLVQATPDDDGFFVSSSLLSSSSYCRPFLRAVGVHDIDVVPNVEGKAQVSTVVLTRLFGGMAYPPLVRMLAVALLFPQSTSLWFVQKQDQEQQSDQSAINDTEPLLNEEETASSPSDHDRGHDSPTDNKDEYILTPALNALVQGTATSAANASAAGTTTNTTTDNLFRQELVKALRGDYGEWRTVSAAILVETLLRSPLLDLKTLGKLQILSPGISNNSSKINNNDDGNSSSSSSPSANLTDLELAVATFLAERQHTCESVVSTVALECMSSLAMHMIYKSAVLFSPEQQQQQGKPPGSSDDAIRSSSSSNNNQMWKALKDTRSYFFRQTLESHQALGVSDIFVDLMEAAVQSRYKRVTTKSSRSRTNSNNNHNSHDHGYTTTANARGPRHRHHQQQQPREMYAYLLSQHGCTVHGTSSEVLIRKLRGVSFNEVEATRFYARMAVHFRAVCRVVERFYHQLDSYQQQQLHPSSAAVKRHQQQQQQNQMLSSPSSMNVPKLDLLDEAEELAVIFGALRAKPAVGTEVDLHGRMAFPFSSSGGSSSNSAAAASAQSSDGSSSSATSTTTRIRTLSGDMIFRSSSRLVLVLDPADMMIVKPTNQQRQQQSRTKQLEAITTERATVLCCVPLLNVIAAAVDGEWLHVAVRHDNVGSLIKNGNMALLFDGSGTSLIVRQYLDRCRQVLRRELSEKIKDLLSTDADKNNDAQDVLKTEPKEKTVKELPTFPSPTVEDSEDAIQCSKTL